ncbi:hypothetical protein JCGZ_25426 [Jatropha curcas]|uniref:Uncharacterized protein n=1 Tax=Jatropha curcas TaxID=180498 RepID=A0A067JLC3_JATCU|nr:hypothetical protein JCGZ_25426 [Jatropha curcas]
MIRMKRRSFCLLGLAGVSPDLPPPRRCKPPSTVVGRSDFTGIEQLIYQNARNLCDELGLGVPNLAGNGLNSGFATAVHGSSVRRVLPAKSIGEKDSPGSEELSTRVPRLKAARNGVDRLKKKMVRCDLLERDLSYFRHQLHE